jgi:ferredoxin
MALDVRTDRDVCIGSENCTRYAPGAFHTDEEGKVIFTPDAGDSEADVRNAVRSCPVGALSLEDRLGDRSS